MSKTKKLTESEFDKTAKSKLLSVFNVFDSTKEVFADNTDRRALLSAFAFRLEPQQLQALVKAAKAVGDDSFFVSAVEPYSGITNGQIDTLVTQSIHFHVPFEDANSYHNLNDTESLIFMLENAIYSPSGSWGIMLSELEFAILGGSDKFVSVFFENLRKTEEENIADVIETWKIEASSWFFSEGPKRVLDHVYGSTRAREFLLNTGYKFI